MITHYNEIYLICFLIGILTSFSTSDISSMALYYEIDINYHTRAKQDSKNYGKANDHYTTNDTNFAQV